MKKRLKRAEVPVELTWNLADIFATKQDWEGELAAIARDLPGITRFKGRLSAGADVLAECLEAAEHLQKRLHRVVAYASLDLSGDGTDPANQTAMGRAQSLGAEAQAAMSFIRSEALELPAGTLESYLEAHEGLKSFARVVLRMIDERPHVLSLETERSLAALGEVLQSPYLVYTRSKAADMAFADIKDSEGTTHPMSFAMYEEAYEKSADFALRRNAWVSFAEGLKKYQNTYGTTWGTEVKKHVVMAKLRGYPSATHMLLHGQEVDPTSYHMLHDVILKEIAPHMRRYARLRKQLLGLTEMLYCDIEAPLDPDYSPETTYDIAADVIKNGLQVLGPEYAAIVAESLSNRWIDLSDNIGKSTGAFCYGVPDAHPYILVTWADNMRGALVLAHEIGHAGHGVLAMRYQRLSNVRGSVFFTEAPSIINELLVGNYIAAQSSDPRLHRWLAMQLLMTYHHNFVRHLIEGELQRRTYAMAEKGQPITANVLSRVQGEILEEFWGGEVTIDEGARLTWMRQPHFYMGLYPYSYSAGLTVGTAVAKAIKERGQPVIDKWLEVLKTGGAKPPVELARMAGVEMTDPAAIKSAVDYVGELVDSVVESFGVDV
ncbi:MAG: Oligoendopeptidase F, plasmid [Firmicutes bacterium]|nr:Oligoendopeptidase F, plasmid [candidate division NPL-UPA2 bacterium]